MKRSQLVGLSSLLLLIVPCYLFSLPFLGFIGVIAAGSGAVLGCLVALVSRRWHLGVLSTLTLMLGVFLLFGPTLAATDPLGRNFYPTLSGLQVLVTSAVTCWRDTLTAPLPLSAAGGAAVLPFLTCLVTALFAGLAATSRRPWVALIPATISLVVAIAWGAQLVPVARWAGAAYFFLALLWCGLVSEAAAKARKRAVNLAGAGKKNRFIRPLAMVAATLIISLASASLAGVSERGNREVLRSHVLPPVELEDFISPLASFRHLSRDWKDKTIAEVNNYPAGTRMRFATMNAYDGTVFKIDPQLNAQFLQVDSILDKGVSADSKAEVKLVNYDQPWVPLLGNAQSLKFATQPKPVVYYSTSLRSAFTANPGRLSYQVSFAKEHIPSDAKMSGLEFDPIPQGKDEAVPIEITELNNQLTARATSPLQKVRNIESYLSGQGFFSDGSDGLSRPGHRAARMSQFFQGQELIGDDEQYAVAMALMVRAFGAPARVVLGAYPGDKKAGGKLKLKGDNVHAWVEVKFKEVGWIPFDPTPSRDRVPRTDQPQPKSVPKPQVLQPPPPPATPPVLPHVEKQAHADNHSTGMQILAALAQVAKYGGWLLLLLSPILLTLLAKWYRSRRRRRAKEPQDRLKGAWEEIVDRFRDRGIRLPAGATRQEAAWIIDSYLGAMSKSQSGARELAGIADYLDYSPSGDSEIDPDWAWQLVKQLTLTWKTAAGKGKALVAAIRPSSLYYRFIRSSFAKKLEVIPGVRKVLTPRKEVSLPSLSLGLTEQEYQQLRTPLAPGGRQEAAPALEGAGEFSEATRLGKVGLPQVGLELTDGTRLKDSQSLPLPAQSVEVPQPPRPPASPMPPEPPALPPQALDYTRRAPSPQNTEETRLRKGEDYDPNTP
ncbi:MAG: hypothetical protein KH307_00875 [Varibaculum cambriense]|uniref:DUF3488 and transglutaminase-like domain-containing protein n=1 Tax=Varibaculum cambriense TaxID=184870 RepID=UPI00241EE4DA|nr:transglutaminase domain-containing protein [Varibaculum cambriense]MBS6618845.1 hypothetical protein [Varibaculum cambriense]